VGQIAGPGVRTGGAGVGPVALGARRRLLPTPASRRGPGTHRQRGVVVDGLTVVAPRSWSGQGQDVGGITSGAGPPCRRPLPLRCLGGGRRGRRVVRLLEGDHLDQGPALSGVRPSRLVHLHGELGQPRSVRRGEVHCQLLLVELDPGHPAGQQRRRPLRRPWRQAHQPGQPPQLLPERREVDVAHRLLRPHGSLRRHAAAGRGGGPAPGPRLLRCLAGRPGRRVRCLSGRADLGAGRLLHRLDVHLCGGVLHPFSGAGGRTPDPRTSLAGDLPGTASHRGGERGQGVPVAPRGLLLLRTGQLRVGGSRVGGSRVGGSRVGGSRVGGSRVGGSRVGGSRVGGSRVGGSRILPQQVVDRHHRVVEGARQLRVVGWRRSTCGRRFLNEHRFLHEPSVSVRRDHLDDLRGWGHGELGRRRDGELGRRRDGELSGPLLIGLGPVSTRRRRSPGRWAHGSSCPSR